MGLLEDALALRRRAGERAALVTEELRLDEVRRDRGAVEDDERSLRARALVVDRLGEDLLAGPRRPLDHDRHVARREPLAERIEPSHLDARAHRVPERRRARDRDRLSLLERVDAEHRVADADHLAALEDRVEHAHARNERSVARLEIDDAQTRVAEVERDVAPRHLRIREAQIAARALPDEHAVRLGSVEDELGAAIRSVDDDELVRARHLDVLSRLDLGRPILSHAEECYSRERCKNSGVTRSMHRSPPEEWRRCTSLD